MIKIDFTIIDTPNIKYRDIDLSCIYLYPNCFVRKISGYVTEDVKEEYFLESVCIHIDHICKIGMYYHQFNDQYYISIEVINGTDNDTYFRSFEECEDAFKKIKNWKFGIL